MNAQIRKVSIFLALLFAALLINITYTSVARTDDLNADSRNRRVRDAEFSQNRGAILVGNTPIAVTKPAKGRFNFQREYPNGPEYAPITGYYSYDFGRSNLEFRYNTELAGTDSSLAFNRFLDIISGRRPSGANIQTTIHPGVQRAAFEAMKGMEGAAVALDYQTGAVLAMVSYPTYDPNELASLDLKAASKAWKRLIKNDAASPLHNRGTRMVFPPGSTFKLVTAAAALEDGMRPDTKVPAPNALALPNTSHTLTNSTNCGGTEITLKQALQTSCNTAFGKIGMDLGQDKLREKAEQFGFNQETNIDLPSSTSQFPKKLDAAQLAMSSIGQFEVKATPLQMAMVTAAVANNGVLMQPYVVSEVQAADLTIIKRTEPKIKSKPLNVANAGLLQEMMLATVEDGTGRTARIDGMKIGGKTGTAQRGPNQPPYAWFVAYADDPAIAVAVVIQSADVSRDQISGSRLAAPVAKAMIEAAR